MESLSDDQALNWPKNWLVLNVWSVKRRVENTLLSVNSDAESSHPTTNHTTAMTIALLFINKRFALNEMFQQNVPKFDLYIAFFFFLFCATLLIPYECWGSCFHKPLYSKGNFIEHKRLISEEWYWTAYIHPKDHE